MSKNVSDVTARVYAQALLEIGEEKDKTGVIIDDLLAVFDVLKDSVDVRNFYESPKVSKQEKAEMLDRFFKGRIEPEVFALLQLLARKDRGPVLDNIVDQVRILRDKANNVVHLNVQTATPLTDEIRSQLLETVSKATGQTVTIHESVKESLLGGLVLRVGDRLIDGSVLKQLNALRKQALNLD